MRDIKFRAWDGRRTMVPACEVVDGYFQLQAGRNYGGFEQFTGLHDKNGKEIYEGDIVSSKMMGCVENKHIGEVKFNPHSGYMPEHGLAYDNSWVEHEIIGNIHENPELLEAKP